MVLQHDEVGQGETPLTVVPHLRGTNELIIVASVCGLVYTPPSSICLAQVCLFPVSTGMTVFAKLVHRQPITSEEPPWDH